MISSREEQYLTQYKPLNQWFSLYYAQPKDKSSKQALGSMCALDKAERVNNINNTRKVIKLRLTESKVNR